MWVVCQLGAREHYAIARALHRSGQLDCLITDLWIRPGQPGTRLPWLRHTAAMRRLCGRYHEELAEAEVLAPNLGTLAGELIHRLRGQHGPAELLSRYGDFQRQAMDVLAGRYAPGMAAQRTLFSYSNTALEMFRFATPRGWKTVLGQVDPGPEEHRIVAEEQQRYAHLRSTWQAAPAHYWDGWHEEISLADRIIVNSEWSHQCLRKVGVPAEKLEIIPLVYEGDPYPPKHRHRQPGAPLRVLFLGQVTLRKGIGRLLEAMRLLRDEPVELTLVGATTISPEAWADLPKVRWVGPVARGEVNRFYDAADVFILPTLSDGFALTQLEALARGLPVIASQRCGAAVSDGQNGWLLPDLEPATIATTLANLDLTQLRGPEATHSSWGIGQLATALVNGRA